MERAHRYIRGLTLSPESYVRLRSTWFSRLIDCGIGLVRRRSKQALKDFISTAVRPRSISLANCDSNAVYTRDVCPTASITIECSPSASGSKVYLGKNLSGSISIKILGSGTVIYIGNDCVLTNFNVKSFQDNDRVYIGNMVTSTSETTLISGRNAGSATPHIIVGDDCMFSYGITLRNTDAHPIVSKDSRVQINVPSDGITIEPHVWLGQNSTVLKDVTVGRGSIIGVGAVVTKNVPPGSFAVGIPAISRELRNAMWVRNMSESAITDAVDLLERGQ